MKEESIYRGQNINYYHYLTLYRAGGWGEP